MLRWPYPCSRQVLPIIPVKKLGYNAYGALFVAPIYEAVRYNGGVLLNGARTIALAIPLPQRRTKGGR